MKPLPEWAKDAVFVQIQARLSFRDRLKILFGARFEIDVKTATENAPGRVASVTDLRIYFPMLFKKIGDGMMALAMPSDIEEFVMEELTKAGKIDPGI